MPFKLRFPVFLMVLSCLKTCSATATEENGESPLFRFGAIADCQYCSATSERRKYELSPEKLESCIEDFNNQELSHVVHLGDFIDKDWESFDVVIPIAEKSTAPFYHVLGNHDFSVADEYKPQVPARLGLADRYYDFKVANWRFLVLDTNDVSLYAYPEESPEYKRALEIYNEWGGDLPTYNGGVGKEQLAWMERKLKAAEVSGETVVVHSHHPVYPVEKHAAWNADEIVALLERYSCVAAYINGHRHDGGYGLKNGIHYLTLKGMVDTEETSYSTVSVFPDRIEVKGVGRQDDYVLEILSR